MGGATSGLSTQANSKISKDSLNESTSIRSVESFITGSYALMDLNNALKVTLENIPALHSYIDFMDSKAGNAGKYVKPGLLNSRNMRKSDKTLDLALLRSMGGENSHSSKPPGDFNLLNDSIKYFPEYVQSIYYKDWRKSEINNAVSFKKYLHIFEGTLPEIVTEADSKLFNPQAEARVVEKLNGNHAAVLPLRFETDVESNTVSGISGESFGGRLLTSANSSKLSAVERFSFLRRSFQDEEGVYGPVTTDGQDSGRADPKGRHPRRSIRSPTFISIIPRRVGVQSSTDSAQTEKLSSTESALRAVDVITVREILTSDSWLIVLMSAMENLPLSFCISTAAEDRPGFPLVYVNKHFEVLTGYRRADVIGANCKFLQSRTRGVYSSEPSSVNCISAALRKPVPHVGMITNYRRDGSPFRNLLGLKPVIDSSGEYRFVLGIQVEIFGDAGFEAFSNTSLKLFELLNTLPGVLQL